MTTEKTNQDGQCKKSNGIPTERAVLERNWINARDALLQCRSTLTGLSFKDKNIVFALETIYIVLEDMRCEE